MIGTASQIALREIRRNITRAFLTVLGIVIGVAAVVTLVTLGNGATESIKSMISELGSNLVVLQPGVKLGTYSSAAPQFTDADIAAIEAQVPGIARIAPVRGWGFNTIYRENARATTVLGSTTDFFRISNRVPGEGRFFTEHEYYTGAAVGVIGATVRDELFGNSDPVGEQLRLGDHVIRVLGVIKTKGQLGTDDQDDQIIVPLTTLRRRLAGQSSLHDINLVTISAKDEVDSRILIYEIRSLMRQRRNLQPNQADDFNVLDTRQIADALDNSGKILTMLLAAIAGISLLVGGIGIMNIMLVSVTERTREIGIRLAIGATAKEVRLQFLMEAVILSCIGGALGLILALGLSALLTHLVNVPFVFSVQINLIAFAFSACIGVIFGFAPAQRAASLDPIDALRHE